MVAGLLVASAAAALAGLVTVAVSGLLSVSWLAARLGWCLGLQAANHRVGSATGALAAVALVAATVSGSRHRRRNRLPVIPSGPTDLVVLPDEDAFAFALPRPPKVVVSAGLLRGLDALERRVVIAHERSHLQRGHHRYLVVGGLAVALVPPLRPLLRWLELATERVADDDAVRAVGDRAAVARTIVHVATLCAHQPVPAVPAFGGSDPLRRVRALLVDRPSRLSTAMWASSAVVVTVGTAVTLAVQGDRLVQLVAHVCV